MKVIDFNVVGGSTHPLLFTWDKLNYRLEPPTEATPPNSGSHGAFPPQSGSSAQNLTTVPQASSRSSQPGKRDSTAQRSGRGDLERVYGHPSPGLEKDGIGGGARDEAEGESGGSGSEVEYSAGVEFRIVTEPNRVQPNMPMFGVPYDLVDNSEGGAYSDMLQKLQEQQLRQDAEE